jgi:hypothetical protein
VIHRSNRALCPYIHILLLFIHAQVYHPRVCSSSNTHTHTYTHTYIHTYIYVYIYIYIYIYIYTYYKIMHFQSLIDRGDTSTITIYCTKLLFIHAQVHHPCVCSSSILEIYICIHVCAYVYVFYTYYNYKIMHFKTLIYIYIYIYTVGS